MGLSSAEGILIVGLAGIHATTSIRALTSLA
jgi:hypothetical protein